MSRTRFLRSRFVARPHERPIEHDRSVDCPILLSVSPTSWGESGGTCEPKRVHVTPAAGILDHARMRLPQPRSGEPLLVKGRPLTFSYFPVKRETRRYGLQDVVFAVDPWAVVEGAVNDQAPAMQRDEALAFVDQARAFYEAGAARTPASPLLTYYAFLNLGKALIRCRGFTGSLDRARHGLSETHTGAGLSGSSVEVHDGGPLVNVFPEVIERLGFPRPLPGPVPVMDLAPQVVVGHRLWREASTRSERFVVLEDIEFIYNRDEKTLWLRLWLRRGDLSRYEITRLRLLEEGGLNAIPFP
jgi:YaaC-like Protein